MDVIKQMRPSIQPIVSQLELLNTCVANLGINPIVNLIAEQASATRTGIKRKQGIACGAAIPLLQEDAGLLTGSDYSSYERGDEWEAHTQGVSTRATASRNGGVKQIT